MTYLTPQQATEALHRAIVDLFETGAQLVREMGNPREDEL